MNIDEYIKDNSYIKGKTDFDEKEIIAGLKKESNEHYDESIKDIKKIIGKIVIDHLNKNPNYYSIDKEIKKKIDALHNITKKAYYEIMQTNIEAIKRLI